MRHRQGIEKVDAIITFIYCVAIIRGLIGAGNLAGSPNIVQAQIAENLVIVINSKHLFY